MPRLSATQVAGIAGALPVIRSRAGLKLRLQLPLVLHDRLPGLHSGERVIVDGLQKVQPGALVSERFADGRGVAKLDGAGRAQH